MTCYCTVDEAKAELKATGTTDDTKLLNHIRRASRRVDSIMNPRLYRPYFAPYIEQREFRAGPYRISSLYNTLDLEAWLLEFSAVTLAGTDITATTQQWPPLARAFKKLQRTSVAYNWYTWDDTDPYPVFVNVTGTWGYHGDYDNAWVKVEDVTTTALNATDVTSTLTVADIDGADIFGDSNRISLGALLKIGTELMEVVASIDTSANTCTVRRAVNGSTIAAHSVGDDIYRWYPEEPIKRAIIRQSCLLYAREGAYQQETLDGVGVISYPLDLLNEMKNTLSEYTYG